MSETLKACDDHIASAGIDTSKPGWKTRLSKPPVFPFEDGKSYFWNIETNHGNIRVKLMPEIAPMHVSSTIFLTKLGFYDDLSFHRVITGFMAQGGCPLGTGTGGPGYQYDGEYSPSARHTKGGLLSMANAGPGTDGSQFFLTFVETGWLDDKHSIFGEVVEGDDTVQELQKRGSRGGQTSEPLKMIKSTIEVV